MEERFNRERVRFHTKNKEILIVQGWFEGDELGEEQFTARLGSQNLPVEVLTQRGAEVTKKYLRYKTNVTAEYFLMISLKDQEYSGRTLHIIHKGKEIVRLSASRIRSLAGHLESWVDSLKELPDGSYQLQGWYVGPEAADFSLCPFPFGKQIPAVCKKTERTDILTEFPEASPEETHGFTLTFARQNAGFLRLKISGEEKEASYTLNAKRLLSGKEGPFLTIRKGWGYLRRKGVRAFFQRVSDVLFGSETVSYDKWRRRYGVTKRELSEQRVTHFAFEPKISIVVPLYRTPEDFLRQMVSSVKSQTYRNWELVLSDGSGTDQLTPLLQELSSKDDRIRVLPNEGRRLSIAENTNAAVSAATGEYFIFGDHDDLFSPDALFSCVQVLNDRPETELIYSDEDKVDAKGKRYFEPHFKPDYSPDLLTSMNYFCHLVLVKRQLFLKAGSFDPAFDGAQDYDFVLRCTEQTDPEKIVHIPKILYHWRSYGDSTSENPESKRYAFEAGQRAVASHFERLGIDAVVTEGVYPGLYDTTYAIKKKDNGELPLISILIPNKDHIADLKNCIRSIESKSDYRNYEYIIIENNSTEQETFEAYRELEAEIPNLHVVKYPETSEFNYSAINNFGAKYAKGDYYLLLNNDTEIINPDCLSQMLGCCQRPEVGIVGALLFYGDDTIQHAGVVLGFGGIAGHAFIGQKRGDNGYFSRILCAQNYSAVTAACMMVKASVYREVGGMTEELKVAFNDIDFCMKVRETGKLVVYTPHAQLYHYESKTRGLEDTPEKIERFNREIAIFLDRWGDRVEAGDPYYNPNLTLNKADFSLKE